MKVEFGVCPNCSEAVLGPGICDRDVALAALAAVGVREVRRDRFHSGRGTAYLLTDDGLPLPRQVYLCPSPEKWQKRAPGELLACESAPAYLPLHEGAPGCPGPRVGLPRFVLR